MTHRNVGDCCELEVLDVFGEEYWLEISEDFYDSYGINLPPHVAQRLIEYERHLKEKPESDEYEAYLTDYYSEFLEDYEAKQQKACPL